MNGSLIHWSNIFSSLYEAESDAAGGVDPEHPAALDARAEEEAEGGDEEGGHTGPDQQPGQDGKPAGDDVQAVHVVAQLKKIG
jgi:hypothetical protein